MESQMNAAVLEPASKRPDLAVLYEPLHEDVVPPTRKTKHSACYDVRAYLRDRQVRRNVQGSNEVIMDWPSQDEERTILLLEPGDIVLVPLGFKARLPEGWEAQIRLRSGLGFKNLIIPNAPGTIDADYPDEWFVQLKNVGTVDVVIEHGERIAQVKLEPYYVLPWVPGTVGQTTERTGGFGSTGRF